MGNQRNLISGIKHSFRKLVTSVKDMGSPKLKEVPIPEHWIDPTITTTLPPVEPTVPVAIEPSIIYEQPIKPGIHLYQPTWFIKVKRIVVFIILIGACASSIGLLSTSPFGLVFTIPTVLLNLDYLLKTQPRSPTMRWDILPDIEKEE